MLSNVEQLCLFAMGRLKVGQYYNIVILKCHDNQYQKEVFSIVISTWYYRDYRKIPCSETCTSVKCFHHIFTILVTVVLLSDIVIISIIVTITLMIYCDMKFLLSPISRVEYFNSTFILILIAFQFLYMYTY